jgi:hypothetical protein
MNHTNQLYNFKSAILRYTKNSIVGWFSACYKVSLHANMLNPREVIRDETTFRLLVAGAQDYFNQTNDKIYSRQDAYVNKFYHHFFATTFEQELPCVFLELLFAFVVGLLRDVWLNDIYFHPPSDSIWQSYDKYILYVSEAVVNRAKRANLLDEFVNKCQFMASSCACKGLTSRPYKQNPLSLSATLIHTKH